MIKVVLSCEPRGVKWFPADNYTVFIDRSVIQRYYQLNGVFNRHFPIKQKIVKIKMANKRIVVSMYEAEANTDEKNKEQICW